MVGRAEEFQAEAETPYYVADDGVGFDAAFLNEEVELGGHALFDLEVRGLDEEAVDADVQDAGDIVAAIAAPADPDVFRGRETGQCAARVRRFLVQERLPGAPARCEGRGLGRRLT